MQSLKPVKKITYAISLLLLFVGMQSATLALTSDRQQPINIQADSAEQSSHEGKAKTIYTGNVIMKQGSLHISGTQVIIYSENHAVTRILATGAPAQFNQQSTLDSPIINATAGQITYTLNDDTIVMLEKASLTQGTSLVTGERIDYNINTAQVKAAGAINTQTGKTNSGRVNMVLEPAKEEPNSDKPIAPETETAITVQPATEKDIHADAISD